MIKLQHNEVWAFDAEWVPDPATGRAVYGGTESFSDGEVVEEMWRQGGATPEDPRPYLKTILCRIISVSVVIRKTDLRPTPKLKLFSLPQPEDGTLAESQLLERFLGAIGRAKPQLVGFNSQSADLKILVQRALVHRLHLPEFCTRPNKPWEGVDYFARGSDYHIDLKEELSSWGNTTPTLHELACACSIPGKLETTGQNVIDLWMDGDIRRIVQYNECDAISTYLLWLRVAHLAGKLSPEAFAQEEGLLEQLLESVGRQPNNEHLLRYLEHWRRLKTRRS